MPKRTEKDRVANFQTRVNASNKMHGKWSKRYACDTLEDYYYGHQCDNETDEIEKRKYVINLFYPSINIRKPSLLFTRPKVRVEPRPGRNDDPNSDLEERARLQEDTLNTFIGMDSFGFDLETSLAVQDAHFRFGITEIGYTADFIDNPNAGKPMLVEDSDQPMLDSKDQQVPQPARIPQEERLYIKWIPGETFRVSANQHNDLQKCDWCGYFEWHHASDIKANPRYKNTANLRPTGKIAKEFEDQPKEMPEDDPHQGMVKLWKIWSLRADGDARKHRVVFAEGGEKFLLDEPYKVFPFADLKFDEILKQWYPLPPTFNWLPPQIELNDSRESLRTHRKRFNRQFQCEPGTIQPEEKDKWEQGGDGTLIEAQGQGIQPINGATSDPTLVQSIPLSKDDFREISGVSGEDTGIADADTATQANILETRSQIRESYGRVQVARWLSNVATIMLRTIKEHMALPVWVKMNADPQSPTVAQEAQRITQLWKQIDSEDLGDLTNDVSVDIESLSPVAEETERNAFNQMLAIVTNPTVAMFLSQSEVLLRKALGYYGVKSEKEIQEVKRAMEQTLMLQAQAAAAAAQAKAGGAGPQGAAPGPTPGNPAIQQQLQQQMKTAVA